MVCKRCEIEGEGFEVIYKLPYSDKILVALCPSCSVIHWDYKMSATADRK